jgi:hypothetical protein
VFITIFAFKRIEVGDGQLPLHGGSAGQKMARNSSEKGCQFLLQSAMLTSRMPLERAVIVSIELREPDRGDRCIVGRVGQLAPNV